MTPVQSNKVLISDNALSDYVAGKLSLAKHLMISCQKKMSKDVACLIALEESSVGSDLTDISNVPLSPSFLSSVISALPQQDRPSSKTVISVNDNAPELILEKSLTNIKWRGFIPGVAVHDIIGDRRFDGHDRLYLFNAKAGLTVPEHSHHGEEWVLVLKGSYTANGQVYRKGDLHIVSDDETHRLQVSDDENCICLAMTQERIKMKRVLPRIAQTVIGL